jgi:tetratricopeptide (TPR) repeat protein
MVVRYKFGVAQVLEGSVRLAGTRLRVTAQLICADNGYHVWSERYDRELRDVFAVQDEIANAVAQAMQIQLMGGTLARREGGTDNLEAYQLYLRTDAATQQQTKASFDESDGYLEQALDPKYGSAWLLMATDAVPRSDSFVSPKDGYGRGRELAQKALEFSPDSPFAYAILQYVHRTLDWDWTAAERAERRAIVLDPNNPWPYVVDSGVSASLGRWEEAGLKIQKALAHDPPNTFRNLATRSRLLPRSAIRGCRGGDPPGCGSSHLTSCGHTPISPRSIALNASRESSTRDGAAGTGRVDSALVSSDCAAGGREER